MPIKSQGVKTLSFRFLQEHKRHKQIERGIEKKQIIFACDKNPNLFKFSYENVQEIGLLTKHILTQTK